MTSRQTCRRFKTKNQSETAHELLFQTFASFQQSYNKKTASNYQQLFGHQLRQVYGCSTSAANALMSKFGTLANFMQYLTERDPKASELMLAQMQKEGDKVGRFGPKLAQRLIEVFLGDY